MPAVRRCYRVVVNSRSLHLSVLLLLDHELAAAAVVDGREEPLPHYLVARVPVQTWLRVGEARRGG